jgi:hypothetical protein
VTSDLTRTFAIYKKKRKASSMKQADLMVKFIGLPRVSIQQPSWYLLTPCLLLHQLLQLRRLQKTEDKPNDTKPARGDIQMEYSPD